MAPSTSPASPPPEPEGFGLDALEGFYRLHARVYDWTRPFLLFARREAARALGGAPGDLLLDVGCGTGFNLSPLAESGAEVVGVEPSRAMRDRAAARLSRLPPPATNRVRLDPRPYGSHADYEGRAAGVLFSYSLSMIPPFAFVLEQARRDLRPHGRLVAVDFLDATRPVAAGLRASHVFLGEARLEALRRIFPEHELSVRRAGLWRYYVFRGES